VHKLQLDSGKKSMACSDRRLRLRRLRRQAAATDSRAAAGRRYNSVLVPCRSHSSKLRHVEVAGIAGAATAAAQAAAARAAAVPRKAMA